LLMISLVSSSTIWSQRAALWMQSTTKSSWRIPYIQQCNKHILISL
jgi:hypothetical protein